MVPFAIIVPDIVIKVLRYALYPNVLMQLLQEKSVEMSKLYINDGSKEEDESPLIQ